MTIPPFPTRPRSATRRAMRRILLLAPLALTACVAPAPAPQPAPVPSPRPTPAPPPPPRVVTWQDGPLTPGDWQWQRDARGSLAMFGVTGRNAGFVVRCDLAQRKISLTVPGDAASGATLIIQTSDGARTLPATATGTQPPYAGAALPAGDGFLDRIAFSRGRFRVQLTGQSAMVIPAWPEFARTIEDCRA